jgi:hypothetical protein
MLTARVRQKLSDDLPDPLPLDVFRRLPQPVQDHACSVLCDYYGDVFRELERVFGNLQSLLEAINFAEFQGGHPDAAHCYIAFLLAENTIRELVTFNWDRLVEIAFEQYVARPIQETASVINDCTSWTQRRYGPSATIVKLHGCASQFPAEIAKIVVTRIHLINASLSERWQVKAMEILFNNVVLICGFSGGDYDACIGIRKIMFDRRANNLPAPVYYLAQPSTVDGVSRDIIEDDNRRHVPLGANDLFATVYFASIKARLRAAIERGRALQACNRPFGWDDDEWASALNRAEVFVNADFPEILDRVIGAPEIRWESEAASFPIWLSDVRQLYLRGEISNRGKYTGLAIQPDKDLTLVLVASAVVDFLRNKPHINLQLGSSCWGVSVMNSQSGSRFQLIPYHGEYAQTAHGAMRAYLERMGRNEKDPPAPKIVVLPCQGYTQSPDNKLAPGPVLRRRFPGDKEPTEHFIPPQRVFGARNFAELKDIVGAELDA